MQSSTSGDTSGSGGFTTDTDVTRWTYIFSLSETMLTFEPTPTKIQLKEFFKAFSYKTSILYSHSLILFLELFLAKIYRELFFSKSQGTDLL